MGKILSYLMFGFAIMTLMMAASVLRKQGKRRIDNILFACFSLGSSVWSLGFGFLLVQTEAEVAYRLRCFGMVGMFAYLIFATFLMARWNGNNSFFVKLSEGFSLSALLLYPFLMQRENITFMLTEFGMKYVFKKGIWNNLYTVYCVILAVNMFILVLQMCKNKKRRWIRVMGKRLLFCELVIIMGMMLDTIMPMFGVGAFPGSSLTQFLGAALLYKTFMFYKSNRININNMSQFVYYSVESPVLIYDYEGNLKVANKSAVEFFDIPEQYENIKIDHLFNVDKKIFQNNKMLLKIDAQCKVNDAHCRLGINKILDVYQEVLGYIIIVDDLTDKIQIIKELEEAKKRADIANRAKSTFLTRMSHEIRTPLNTVFGMNEMILREGKSEKIIEYARRIKGASEILLGIINDILDLSKLEAGKIHVIEANYYLPDMMRNVLNVVSLTREEKGLAFELDVENGIPKVLYGDELRIKQIITNVMNNAVKYTEKGKITLRLHWKSLSEERVELNFQVEDTGTGIRKEDMVKLFKPYERLNEHKNHMIEGHGLGLAITKELLDLMGGRMEVESEYKKGSNFSIFIPQRVVVGEELEAFCKEKKLSVGKEDWKEDDFTIPQIPVKMDYETLIAPNIRILVVDDTVSNLVVMQELLRRTQIKVDLVKSGKDCLKIVSKKTYHIIFLDHMMPEMDGIETLTKLRNLKNNPNAHIPIIAMTANAILGSRKKYLEYGFTDYLSKPVDYRVLENVIRKYIKIL